MFPQLRFCAIEIRLRPAADILPRPRLAPRFAPFSKASIRSSISLVQSSASDAFCGVPFQIWLRSPHFLLGVMSWRRPSETDAILTDFDKAKILVVSQAELLRGLKDFRSVHRC